MKYSLFVFLFLFPFLVIAQSMPEQNPKTWYLSGASYQNGYVFATNDFVRGTNTERETINHFQTLSLTLSKQTDGQHAWEQLFNYPEWGISIAVYDFFNPEEVGNPIAFYGFFNAPIFKQEKFSFNYELSFGATFNWKRYDPITNKYNIAIGAGESFIIDAGLNLDYHLHKNLVLETGFSLTHFSNGALKKPNFGLNTIAPKIALKFHPGQTPTYRQHTIPDFISKTELTILAFGGVKNVIYDSVDVSVLEQYEGVYFPVFGASATLNRQIGYKSKFGLGVSVSYNGALNAQIAVDNNELEISDSPFTDQLQLSIFPSYEYVVNRLSLILQPSVYLYRKKTSSLTPTFYQKIGLKYYLKENLFVGLTLRDYSFHVSDFIEWNVGYNLQWK